MSTTVSHPIPTAQDQAIADLTSYEDAATLRWQQACVQAAQQLQSDPGRFPTGLDPARLARGRALAQRGAVRTDDEGASHTVRAGKRTYTFRHGHICPCDDRTRSQRPCQHELAVAVHLGALGLGAAMPPAVPEASATPAPRAVRPTAATWPTSEAPASMNGRVPEPCG